MKSKEELNALKEEVETVNRKLHELTDEELAEVSGGGSQTYGGYEFTDGMAFVTSKHPNETCHIWFTTPSGLWYTIGTNPTAYSASFEDLNPIPKKKWEWYHNMYCAVRNAVPPVWGVMTPIWE